MAALQEVAAKHLEIGSIILELERRGEDLAEVKRLIGWTFHILRRLALGEISPAAFQRFVGLKRLLEIVADLPMETQERLASGAEVPLLRDRKLLHADPMELSQAEMVQVFASGAIRDHQEQEAWLKKNRRREPIGSGRHNRPGRSNRATDDDDIDAPAARLSDDLAPQEECEQRLCELRDRFRHLKGFTPVWKAIDAILPPKRST